YIVNYVVKYIYIGGAKMPRKNINTTLDEDLYTEIKILAIKLKTNANDLIEEGMKHVIEKYEEQNNKS
uniref:ribbon-helix-helix domain-containing protein n=1 Tax=Clostridiisalibacter paucivorans TaxID=408753 RepID=UPI001FDF316D